MELDAEHDEYLSQRVEEVRQWLGAGGLNDEAMQAVRRFADAGSVVVEIVADAAAALDAFGRAAAGWWMPPVPSSVAPRSGRSFEARYALQRARKQRRVRRGH